MSEKKVENMRVENNGDGARILRQSMMVVVSRCYLDQTMSAECQKESTIVYIQKGAAIILKKLWIIINFQLSIIKLILAYRQSMMIWMNAINVVQRYQFQTIVITFIIVSIIMDGDECSGRAMLSN